MFRCPTLFLLLPVALLALAPLAARPQEEKTSSRVSWQTDLNAAQTEARTSHRPLLVLFRCAHDRELTALDSAVTRPTDPVLARLLADRFVCVRLMNLRGVDLNTFRFDYDLTLAAVVIDPVSGATLTRWGTRDGDSATARLSAAGLTRALSRVAENYRPGTALTTSRKPFTVADHPVFAGSKRAKEPCYHCHYATDARYAQERKDGVFRKAELWQYPLPENIGITLDPQQNDTVTRVLPNSPAAKSGIQPRDRIERAGNTPVFTAADLQTALDTAPASGKITLRLIRDGKPRTTTLALPSGWRETDISWRPSQGAIPPFIGIWEKPLSDSERKIAGIPDGKLALQITSLFSGERWAPTYGDLRLGDIIVAADGKELPTMLPRQFHAWFRMHHEVGQTATLTVLRNGARIDIPLQCRDVTFD